MNLLQIMQGAQSGTLDAKKEVNKLLTGMKPAQKKALLNMLPQVENFAKRLGISIDGFYDDARDLIYNTKERRY